MFHASNLSVRNFRLMYPRSSRVLNRSPAAAIECAGAEADQTAVQPRRRRGASGEGHPETAAHDPAAALSAEIPGDSRWPVRPGDEHGWLRTGETPQAHEMASESVVTKRRPICSDQRSAIDTLVLRRWGESVGVRGCSLFSTANKTCRPPRSGT